MRGISQGGSDPTEVHQEGVCHHLVVFRGGELPWHPCCHTEHSLSFPSVHFTACCLPKCGWRHCGRRPLWVKLPLSAIPASSAEDCDRAGSLSSGSGYELTQGRDVCGRLSSSSTDGSRQLLPLCSHRLHSLHLFPFSARNNFKGGL